jgi:tight adherence protein B
MRQTALGTAADELPLPVVELEVFDQQNFGLPVQDALNSWPCAFQFSTSSSLSRRSRSARERWQPGEILDNLAHVRERFKIQRQVRTHTAHGRFTGFVLLALPAALAVALSFISPEHIEMLVSEPMGRMMIAVAIVMQTIGFVWIRQVIKIEV